ncbi:uncharacterized protein IAS62_006408 [Cryptococcus decagattii]|uniref:Uncharacterized protein n=1 Tax=Cryptococcus decagattii TaxID=1859122 RepID=A0ABZ2B3P9_9TREE
MVFSFPHFSPRVFSFIDTSPPVIYPGPKHNPLSKGHFKSSESIKTPTKKPSCLPVPPFSKSQHRSSRHSISIARPSEGRGLGTLAASMSALDLNATWKPLPGGGLEEKRMSVERTNSQLPARPRHKRSQSAVQLPAKSLLSISPSGEPGPQNRLQEFSRNPLASVSATSLPTLAELKLPTEELGVSASGPVINGHRISMPPSPIVKPKNRLSRGASIISTASTSGPLSPDMVMVSTFSDSDTRSRSLVPPPQPASTSQTQAAYASMPPPPLRPDPDSITYSPSRNVSRPIPSLTHSFQNAPPSRLHRPCHQRRASVDSVASVELSDVAVIATWSFPASPSPEKQPRFASSREPTQDHDKDKRLDTSYGTSSNDDPHSNSSGKTSMSTSESSETVIRASKPLPSYLTGRHRHTYSSPNLVVHMPSGTGSPSSTGPPPNALLPTLRQQRRTTTTRLRKPNPLSMHTSNSASTATLRKANSSTGAKGELSSSPESMISDTTTCPSPTLSVRSLATGMAITVHVDGENNEKEEETTWWHVMPSLRRRSKSRVSEKSATSEVESLDGTPLGGDTQERSEEDEFGLGVDDQEEKYIDMDHM